MPHALWVAISLGIAAAAPPPTPADRGRGEPTLHFELDLTIEPLVARTVVVVPVQEQRELPQAVHRRLVGALRKELGDNVIIPAERIEAAAKGIDRDQLRTVAGMTTLAKSLGAARLLVFEESKAGVVVHVFNSEGLALRSVELEGVKKFSSAKDARRVAKLFNARAEEALSDAPAPEPEPEPEPLAELQIDPVPLVPPQPEGIDPTLDIALEEERRRGGPRYGPGRTTRREFPVAQIGVGAAAGLRQLSASGSDAAALLPLESGALPSIGLHAVLQPLQLSSAFADAGWSGVFLEGRFRRALAHVQRDSERCSVIDQDWLARAGWQSRPEKRSMPRLGGGAGFGSEEIRYGCELPTVSSRYRYAEVHARVAQPFAGDLFLFELVFAPRFVFQGPGVDHSAFSWTAEGWLTANLSRWMFARGGARFHQTRVERGDALSLVDSRQFFALEVGVQIP